ncbi:MAG: DUF1292 domain-containing protein [Lachnospirales bacterium]
MISEENLVVLTDSKGNEVELEFLDIIDYGGYQYAVLAMENSDEVIIMQYIEDEENNRASYEDVLNDDVINNVFEIFLNNN